MRKAVVKSASIIGARLGRVVVEFCYQRGKGHGILIEAAPKR